MKNIIIITILGLIACDSNEQMNNKLKNNQINRLEYVKDKRTNLCFVGYYLGRTDGSFTNVPCTPEVEKLIK